MSVPDSTRRRDDIVVIEDAKVVVNRPKAVLCEAEALEDLYENDRWIPHSQVDRDSEIDEDSKKNDTGDLVVTLWIAEQKGIA